MNFKQLSKTWTKCAKKCPWFYKINVNTDKYEHTNLKNVQKGKEIQVLLDTCNTFHGLECFLFKMKDFLPIMFEEVVL